MSLELIMEECTMAPGLARPVGRGAGQLCSSANQDAHLLGRNVLGVMSWAGQDGPAWLRSVSTLTIGGVGVQAPQRGEDVGQELVPA